MQKKILTTVLQAPLQAQGISMATLSHQHEDAEAEADQERELQLLTPQDVQEAVREGQVCNYDLVFVIGAIS